MRLLVTGATGYLGGAVARTLADLAEDVEVSRQHVLRAIGFRRAL